MKRRVAITGLGLLTACGYGWKPYWEAVLEGQSFIRSLDPAKHAYPIRHAGEVSNFDPALFIKQRKSLKVMSREIQMAVAASYLALEDSMINLTEVDRTRFGISLGTGIINNDLDEMGSGIKAALDENGKFQMKKFGNEGIRALFPLWFLKYLPNMPACHISIAHGLGGPSNTVTTSSAAATQAIGEAFQVIQRGDADLMIAGGTDSKINAMGISRLYLLGVLSKTAGDAQKAYRPFDEARDGMILGEGAGLIVLEEWEHARRRGARIYGELAGYGASSDYSYDPRINEDFVGKRTAMVRALSDSNTSPSDIHLLFSNGSGIPKEDVQETRAVHEVFEKAIRSVKVTGVKPITGHLTYGSGGVEISAAVLSLAQGVMPPLANLENPDPECNLPFVVKEKQVSGARSVLLNSFGLSGQNASLVLRKVS